MKNETERQPTVRIKMSRIGGSGEEESGKRFRDGNGERERGKRKEELLTCLVRFKIRFRKNN